MIEDPLGADRGQIPFFSLVPFFLVAFCLAWGILALFIFVPDKMTALFGELTGQHPLFFLAVYAPAIAAFIVVFYYGGCYRLAALPGQAATLAQLYGLVCVFDCRHSATFLLRVCVEGKPFL